MKKNITMIVLSHILFAFVLFFCVDIKVDAAGITQTETTQNSVTISWLDQSTSQYKVTAYKVYVGESSTAYHLYATLNGDQRSLRIDGLSAGCERIVKIVWEVEYYSMYDSFRSDDHSMTEIITTLPGKVTGFKQECWYYFDASFSAEWNLQYGVDGYEYIIKDSKKRVKASRTISKFQNYIEVKKVSNREVYSGQIRAFKIINGTTYYGAWSDTAYFFSQPGITKLKVSGGKLIVKWKKVAGVTGYDIYVSTKTKRGYKKVKSVSGKYSSATIKKYGKKKFSKKKPYYVYVVAKKKANNRTWSSGRKNYWNSQNMLWGTFF